MKSAKLGSALAMILIAMALPLKADIVPDQSRIAPFAPQVPGLDLGNLSESGIAGVKYR